MIWEISLRPEFREVSGFRRLLPADGTFEGTVVELPFAAIVTEPRGVFRKRKWFGKRVPGAPGRFPLSVEEWVRLMEPSKTNSLLSHRASIGSRVSGSPP